MEEKRKLSYLVISFLVILSIIIYYFLGVKYDLSIASKLLISLISLTLFIYSYKLGAYQLTLSTLTGFTIFLSLGMIFGSKHITDSPLNISLVLNPWAIFFISLFACLIILFLYSKLNINDKYPLLLLILFIIIWIILAFNARYYEDWKMENWLTVPAVIIIYIVHRWFKLSNLSYTLIFTFMFMHITGSHYTYAEVPLGVWMQNFFGVTRNHYDRIVHFSFGLLWAYPVREVAKRIGQLKGVWAIWIPIELVLALSCIYELFEWAVAVLFGGDLGIAYLGSQGDIWDAQKDMLMAGIGSIIAMIVTSLFILRYDAKGFWEEFKESFKVKDKEVLGERALSKLRRRQ